MAEVLDEQSDLTNGEDPVMDVKDGSVEFDHVALPTAKDGEKAVCEDIDLNIKSGETIGIIGGTGGQDQPCAAAAPPVRRDRGQRAIGGVDVRV